MLERPVGFADYNNSVTSIAAGQILVVDDSRRVVAITEALRVGVAGNLREHLEAWDTTFTSETGPVSNAGAERAGRLKSFLDGAKRGSGETGSLTVMKGSGMCLFDYRSVVGQSIRATDPHRLRVSVGNIPYPYRQRDDNGELIDVELSLVDLQSMVRRANRLIETASGGAYPAKDRPPVVVVEKPVEEVVKLPAVTARRRWWHRRS